MENIFDKHVFDSVKTRFDSLSENSEGQWGKMTVGQMVHHCQAPLNIILLRKDYGFKPNWLINLLFKRSMYNDKPWKKNMPTAKPFRETETRDFNIEKTELIKLLDELGSQRDRQEWQPHPSFGKLTKDQWGQMQFKHLDHHLKQFGV